MKYLKLFENTKLSKFTIVTFEHGEYVKSLYIDGKLHIYGDYYHNKIDELINGFIDGAKWAGTNIEVDKITCKNRKISEDVCENGGIPPKYIQELT